MNNYILILGIKYLSKGISCFWLSKVKNQVSYSAVNKFV